MPASRMKLNHFQATGTICGDIGKVAGPFRPCLISPLSPPERFDRDFFFVVLGFGDGYCAGPQTRSWFEWCRNECFRLAGWQIAGVRLRSQDGGCPPPLSYPLALIAPSSHVLDLFRKTTASRVQRYRRRRSRPSPTTCIRYGRTMRRTRLPPPRRKEAASVDVSYLILPRRRH
jgi:hypothetical protein